jgi:hypothetical protein
VPCDARWVNARQVKTRLQAYHGQMLHKEATDAVGSGHYVRANCAKLGYRSIRDGVDAADIFCDRFILREVATHRESCHTSTTVRTHVHKREANGLPSSWSQSLCRGWGCAASLAHFRLAPWRSNLKCVAR